jgi:hypothetical protein
MLSRCSHSSAFRRLGVALALAGTLAVLPDGPRVARAQGEPIPTEVASSVDRALAWLARSQESNGSWTSSGSSGAYSVAITGLCGMAFMARGHVPGQGPYGENLNRAVDYLLAQQRDSLLAGRTFGNNTMYEHGIATIMLCEAYGMLDERRQEAARGAINRAVALILRAQKVAKSRGKGGWRYTPDATDSDLSVSGWQLMALRAAANAGAILPPEAIEDGLNYVRSCAVGNGSGGFAYSEGRGVTPALTGTGILALILLGKEDDPRVKAAASYLLRSGNLLRSNNYYYTLYYCAQAAWQLGGPYWTQINAEVSSDLRRRQQRDGSWTSTGVSDGQGPSYATAMAVLALTVPYRYLPLYQR